MIWLISTGWNVLHDIRRQGMGARGVCRMHSIYTLAIVYGICLCNTYFASEKKDTDGVSLKHASSHTNHQTRS
jgi:hypothetical protein